MNSFVMIYAVEYGSLFPEILNVEKCWILEISILLNKWLESIKQNMLRELMVCNLSAGPLDQDKLQGK